MSTKKMNRFVRMTCLLLALAGLTRAGEMIVVPKDFPTIHAALGEAYEGDTVFVEKGVYYESIALMDNVVLLGEDMRTTIIDGQRKGPCVLGADGAVISGFTIRNGTTGILCKNTRPVIENNLIIDNKGTGVHILISLPDINNNIIYRNEWTGVFLESVRGTRTAIEHNVIVENGYGGIFAANRTEVLVRNNIMAGNKQYGIFVGPEARKTRIINNNFYMNRLSHNADANIHNSNITQDPMFKSPGHPNFDYHVQPVSICKGKGENGSDIGLFAAKVVQVDGNNDQDGDGIPDDADLCPNEPEDVDGYEDEDGCPDYDNDEDGIYDEDDQCPDEPEDMDGFQDNDGCPDPDNDMDGIPDVADACPNQPETVNDFKDDDGCPDEKPQEIKQTMILRGVNFKTASSELLEDSYYVLEQVYHSLEAFPNLNVEIAGHTDDQGNDDYNMALSYNRAKAVMTFLVDRGIPQERIVARGYGEERPIASNDTPEGRATNRRVEVIPLK
ncbi:MAG: OmpA family protein [Chitinispirillaceae bacterium]